MCLVCLLCLNVLDYEYDIPHVHAHGYLCGVPNTSVHDDMYGVFNVYVTDHVYGLPKCLLYMIMCMMYPVCPTVHDPVCGAPDRHFAYSSSSSTFPIMLDLQSGEYGEVCSLPPCLNRSPKLPVGIHRPGPCLASQSVEGGAGLQDVVGGLRTCAAWTLV